MKHIYYRYSLLHFIGLNGLWSPFGIETVESWPLRAVLFWWLNGLWSPFGIETLAAPAMPHSVPWAKWPVEPVRD